MTLVFCARPDGWDGDLSVTAWVDARGAHLQINTSQARVELVEPLAVAVQGEVGELQAVLKEACEYLLAAERALREEERSKEAYRGGPR